MAELEHAKRANAALPEAERVMLERTRKVEQALGYVPPEEISGRRAGGYLHELTPSHTEPAETPHDVIERCASVVARLRHDIVEHGYIAKAVLDAAGYERLREEKAEADRLLDELSVAISDAKPRSESKRQALIERAEQAERERADWEQSARGCRDEVLLLRQKLAAIEKVAEAAYRDLNFTSWNNHDPSAREVRNAMRVNSALDMLREALDAAKQPTGAVQRGLDSAAQAKTSARVTAEDEGLWIPEPLSRDTRAIIAAIWECTRPDGYDPNAQGKLGGVDYVKQLEARMGER